MKNLILFVRYQKLQILVLLFLVLIPYGLVCSYLPSIPYMHYFFLIAIFVTKILVFNDQQLKSKIKPMVQSHLAKELKQNPSRDQVYQRIHFIIMARNLSLLLAATTIIIMSIIFGKF